MTMAKRAHQRYGRQPFVPLGSVLRKALPEINLERRLHEQRIWEHWPEIAGAQVAAVAQPSSVSRRTLYVDVADSMWMQQLSFMQPLFLERIATCAGEGLVERVFFRLGALETASRSAPAPQPAADAASHAAEPVPDELRREIERLVAEVSEDRLRGVVRRLLLRYAARGQAARAEDRS